MKAALTLLLCSIGLSLPSASLGRGAADPVAAVGARHYSATHSLKAANGETIRYRATAEDVVVPVPGGKTAFFAYSYERVARDPAAMPVIFAYNGGQVSSSVYLHMGLLGPRIFLFDPGYEKQKKPGHLVDNPDTLLDVADIVVIDAPNAGLSRMIDGTPPEAVGGTDEDADAFVAFIRTWLARHGRTASPKYLLGESYGSVRSAAVVQRLRTAKDPIRVAGVILLGQALDQGATTARTGNDLAYTLLLPAQAATAWYHRRAGQGSDLRAFVAAADHWAKTDYIQALLAIGTLTEARKVAAATRLSSFNGLPVAYNLSRNLRVDRIAFAQALLADRGQRVSQYDGRLQEPASADTSYAADRIETDIAATYRSGLSDYLRTELGIPFGADYRVDFNHKNWRFVYPVTRWWYDYTPFLADAMVADPDLRIFFGCGDYDILTPPASAVHAATHAGMPMDRVVFGHYGAGHMPYLGVENARALSDDIRHFIVGARK